MFSHITVGVRDLEVSSRFYDDVLGALGMVRHGQYDDSQKSRGWMRPGTSAPAFYAHLPANGFPATWGNGTQVSFIAPSRESLDRAFQAVIENGGTMRVPPDFGMVMAMTITQPTAAIRTATSCVSSIRDSWRKLCRNND
ncbi:VOC family protein [Agrobacterium sp. MCAB5]|uniref:VOC family protein n=1 Tax=Agrobacterium sp. MCAB5 TaxID=3233042 RepID=UPI003F919481